MALEQLPVLLVGRRRAGKDRRVIISHPFAKAEKPTASFRKRMGHPRVFLGREESSGRVGHPHSVNLIKRSCEVRNDGIK